MKSGWDREGGREGGGEEEEEEVRSKLMEGKLT